MKINKLIGKVAMFMAVGSMAFIYSCKKDEGLDGQDSSDAVSESLTDSYYEDADDMSITAANGTASPARMATSVDDRFCSDVTYSGNQTSGTAVIDFGTTGCTDPRGNVRKGKINIAYSGGPVGTNGFTVVETYDGYSINGVQLEGTRTVVRESSTATAVTHSIDLSNGKATWADGTYSTRTSSFVRTVDTSAGTVTLSGDASGVNRNAKAYTMDITNPLVYKKSCAETNKIYMAVQGTKVFTTATKTLTLDFGTGECDRAITVTVNKVSFNVTVNK